MRRIPKLLALVALGLPTAHSARAVESSAAVTPHAQVSVASETDAVEPGRPFRLGLHFRLAPGWHIYWINPGDAGEPPRLDLILPEGARNSDIVWPVPSRISDGSVMTYGYRGEVLLPLTVTAPPRISTLPIDAKASWLVCEKICVPEEGSFHLDIPVGATSSSAQASLFAAADQRTPQSSPFVTKLAPDSTLSVEGKEISATSAADAWFLPDKWGAINDGAPQRLAVAAGKLILGLTRGQDFDSNAALTGVLVVRDASGKETYYRIVANLDGAAITAAARHEGASTSSMPPETSPSELGDLGVLTMVAFAFLGGLILNLMPCVFPILAIKAVGIAKAAAHDRAAARAHAASYTLGVLIAFAVLGLWLFALRAAGIAAGWGFQFQSPAFVAAMAWLLLIIGLNLSGVFQVNASIGAAGETLAARGGHLGSFFTGLLAVMVATPCTAPFMGAAVAAALSFSSAATLLVFLAMGLGLAAPYAVLAISPPLARMLPRPGEWMKVLKEALAFPMYASAAWLLWVISQQVGPRGVLITTAGMVLSGFAAWVLGSTQYRSDGWRGTGRAAAFVATLAAAGALYDIATAPPLGGSAQASVQGEPEPYSAARLAALRAAGRPVFVNMTAAWCVTCLVNERVALSSDAVRKAFAERHVAYLKGDWTRADPAITEFLRKHERDGVPLYVLYGPKSASPVVLPQILTAGTVLAELGRLGS